MDAEPVSVASRDSDLPEPPAAVDVRRRPRWQDVLIIGPIIVNSIYYYAGLPLNAIFIGTRPVFLELIRGSTVSMIAAGGFARVGRAALPATIVAPILISMWTDPCYFYAGRRYGRRILEYYERTDPAWRKRIARGERFFRRFGLWTVVFAPFLPVPSALFYLAAGEAGVPFLAFIAADLAGTLLYIVMFVAVGWFVGQHAVDVAQTISHYALWSIVATFALVIIWSFWSSWRNPKEKPL